MCCRKTKAFTLIEMLVVIAIIVMAMLLAIPAIRSMTGSRSIAAAENAVSTAVSAARTEAIARQQTIGVLFYLDTTTDRVGCVLVQQAAKDDTTDPASVTLTYLDKLPDKEPLTLPAGIRLRVMKDTRGSGTGVLQDYCGGMYLGFNQPVGDTPAEPTGTAQMRPGGIILFDSSGHLITRPCGFRFTIPFNKETNTPAHISEMGLFVYGSAAQGTTPPNWPNKPGMSATVPYYPSSIGAVLFDRETFAGQVGQNGSNLVDWNDPGTQVDADVWINNNCTPVFINRYDGSIMRAE